MNDYTWPSVYFAYFFFALMVALAAIFLVKTLRDGYWGKDGEEIKYQVFDSSEGIERSAR
jgi:hypothetical protein